MVESGEDARSMLKVEASYTVLRSVSLACCSFGAAVLLLW